MRNIIIFDDFFQNPDQVRSDVLNAGFRSIPGGTYPGRMSDPFISPGIADFFSSIIGAEARSAPNSWFGQFRVSLANDEFKQWIHVDPIAWSAIAYLNPEGTYPEGYGTAFWKHKATGWNGIPGSLGANSQVFLNEDAASKNIKDYTEFRSKIIYGDGLDESKWNLDLFVPGKYNRIVIFRPTLFHSHMPKFNFGDTDETGRLIQLYFFDEGRL
jgi:hypothetical protein